MNRREVAPHDGVARARHGGADAHLHGDPGTERHAHRRRAAARGELRDARYPLDPSLRRGLVCPAARVAHRRAAGPAAAQGAARADPEQGVPAQGDAEEMARHAARRARWRRLRRGPRSLARARGRRPRHGGLPARTGDDAAAQRPRGRKPSVPALSIQKPSFAFVLLLLAFGAQAQTRSLPDFTSLMKAAGPSVVNVISTRKAQTAAAGGTAESTQDPLTELLRRYMPDLPDRPQPRQGLGSGFIISEDGYILTNAHVVAEYDDVNVRLADAKREFKARVVGVDKRSDVALLKVEAEGLPTARLGDSSVLEAGDWVAAIGSPFGFANTITAGIVSAKGRSLPDEMYVPFIQTDVAVNPGNSGGPLLNLQGEVVGVNSMIYSGTGGYMGVSFAIPIEVALDVSRQLKDQGKVTRGRIGSAIQPLTAELARSFGLKSPAGAVIINVEKAGPAAKAGARIGGVVLEV